MDLDSYLRIKYLRINLIDRLLTNLHLIFLALGRASVKKQDVKNLAEFGFSRVCNLLFVVVVVVVVGE